MTKMIKVSNEFDERYYRSFDLASGYEGEKTVLIPEELFNELREAEKAYDAALNKVKVFTYGKSK